MLEIIIYSFIIILLPIIPAYILYKMIPTQEGSVEGKYQGLNIKLKGAFAGYFITALLLTGFIGSRLVTQSPYEYWTIEGVIDTSKVNDPHMVQYSIEPPDQQKYADGRFWIKNVPIYKSEDKCPTLVVAKISDGQRVEEVIHLEETKKAFETNKKHKVKFKDGIISIETPITLETKIVQKSNWSEYPPENITFPKQINNNIGGDNAN